MHAYRPDHYEELGVARHADAERIRTAYRALAKQLHPDLSEDSRSESTEAFLRLQEAYDVLRDPQRRALYDQELDRRAALDHAAREAARRPIEPGAAPTTVPNATAVPRPVPGRPPRPSRLPGLGVFVAAIALVVFVTAGILTWRLLSRPEPPAISSVEVEPDNPGRPARGGGSASKEASDPGSLSKEADRAVQAQVERVEAARKRMAAQLAELDARKPSSSGGSPSKPPTMRMARVECIGRGTNIVLTRENDVAKVSYDKGPKVQARVSDLGTGTVLVSRIEPTNKMAIAFTKGDSNGTTLLMFDQAGSVQQTFNVTCTGVAF